MKGSEFVFDYVDLLYYKCDRTNPNRGGSYIDSPDWIKSKNAVINPVNKKDNKCFQYAVTVALNHEKTGKHAKGITKIKPFINEYKREGINFSSEKQDTKKFEKNNVTTALNALYVKKEKIYPVYVSKNNSNQEKQVIILMILNDVGKQWHYLAVKKIISIIKRNNIKK